MWMYLLDPNNEQEMVNVVKNHCVFLGLPDGTIKRALKQAKLYDSFDHKNSKTLATYLFDSLSPKLQSHLDLLMKPAEKELFICVWIRVLAHPFARGE